MVLSLIVLLIGFASGFPVDDTQLVGSSLHQVLARPPADLKAAGDSSGYHDGGGDGDEGYHHTKSSKGDDGYKNYDTFHVKDGDSYGYEKHSAYGKADGDEDGGEYHESGSYNSDDGGEGTAQKPKVTSYHYESQSGTPKDYSNYNPETAGDDEYEGSSLNEKIVPAESRRVHQDVEITGPLRGPKFQSLADHSGQNPASKKTLKRLKKKTKNRDAQSASTDAEAEYDAYYDGEAEEGDSGEHEGGGDYEGDYSSEGGDYYSEGEGEGSDY